MLNHLRFSFILFSLTCILVIVDKSNAKCKFKIIFRRQIFFKHLTCESKTTSDMISYDPYISLIIRIFFHGYSNFSEERKPPNISHFSCHKIKNNNKLTVWLLAEAATGRVLLKKGVLLKNICVGFSFLIKLQTWSLQFCLKKDSCTCVFLWIFQIFKSTYFIKHLRTTCPALKTAHLYTVSVRGYKFSNTVFRTQPFN